MDDTLCFFVGSFKYKGKFRVTCLCKTIVKFMVCIQAGARLNIPIAMQKGEC
jgi:hypothetical protein